MMIRRYIMAAPTLIVGLGGTGSKIVQKVYNLATPAQRKNLSFVVFDTDINELRDITEKTPAIKTVQTSAKLTVGEYLDADRFARDTWFPVNKIMNRKALTEGAGQVRSISRLAFNTAIQQGKLAPLEEAITNLYIMSGDKGAQAMRVMLVGSLCGGTGSGLLLPVSLYIRNYLKTSLQQGSAVIRGFFILPEVFYKVIHTVPERNNLKCNAYAAVREIDAFFMKGDGSLPENYDLHYMVPTPGSNIRLDMADSPMDFCFLYDAQNMDGQQLKTFPDYLDHAANCIYAQSIAPTSKRSNSSEDNVIGEVVQAGGRNRYCGAGSSLLEYPVDDVTRYLTLIWARDNISTEWLNLDREFKKKQKEYLTQKRNGINAQPVDRVAEYISGVEAGAKADPKDPFLASVWGMCYEYKPNGIIPLNPYWKHYQAKLEEHIKDAIKDVKEEEDIKAIIDDCKAAKTACDPDAKSGSSSVGGLGNKFDTWYTTLLEFKEVTTKYTQSIGERLAYSLFRDESDYSMTDEQYRIEYWMRQANGGSGMIHPNAIRFFLANTLTDLKRKFSEMNGSAMLGEKSGNQDGGVGNTKQNCEEYWKNFEKNAFDDDSTEEEETESSGYYKRTHMNETEWFRQILYKKDIAAARDELFGKMESYFTKTNAYWELNVSCIVYATAIKYLESLIAAYESFYDVLEKKVAGLNKDIEELEEKYVINDADEKDGKTVRYVCADKECLRAISDEVINLGSSLDIPAELTRIIYTKVRRYAMADTKPKSERYFSDTYEGSILDFYKRSIMASYESTVCMDVLSALSYEATVKRSDEELSDSDKEIYAKHVIESVKHRARPFIDSPIGREPRVIPACTYSTKLAEADVPGRKSFVSQNLSDYGGVADNDIDPNRIVFFQAVYSLRANELGKFAPPRKAETFTDSNGGEYYRAYFERINRIHPDPRRSRAITPHIDRWWHVITKLPDLDDESQKKQEYDIDAAFFWGMLNGAIVYDKDDLMKYVYKLNIEYFDEEIKGEDAELTVSNGTPCDNFYEVLDALTIFPKVVNDIMDNTGRRVVHDLNGQVKLENSYLFHLLKKFRIAEFPINVGEAKDEVVLKETRDGILEQQQSMLDENESRMGTTRSILEIPLLMKRSVPAEDYYEETMMHLLGTELSEIKKYLERFCNKIEFQEEYAKLLIAQYELFFDNATTEDALRGDVFRDPLFVRICNVVAKELDLLYQDEYAETIRVMLKLKALDK